MKRKALEGQRKRKAGFPKWESKLHDQELVKSQLITDALHRVTAKFIPIYCGPYIIAQTITPSTYELSSSDGKIRGEFNKRTYKLFLQENETA
jgi:hypothetical protein